ncbi:Chromodomain-helicase-DNA-binding protein 9 [Entomortierella lignicola]|nr:Chromodomain-helicase-DNA-binding protein 9 [Entomortierella lignicola]
MDQSHLTSPLTSPPLQAAQLQQAQALALAQVQQAQQAQQAQELARQQAQARAQAQAQAQAQVHAQTQAQAQAHILARTQPMNAQHSLQQQQQQQQQQRLLQQQQQAYQQQQTQSVLHHNSYSQLPAHLNQQFSVNGSTAIATHTIAPAVAVTPAPAAAKSARQPAARGRGGAKAASGATRKQAQRTAALQNKAIHPSFGSDDNSDSESGSSSSGDGESSAASASESEESDQEFKGKTPPPTKKATGRKKKTAKAGGSVSHWAVPYDPVLVPMASKTLEKILAWRMHEGKEELLIKHKYSSYLHVEWVPRKKIEEGEHLGKNRVKKFMEKYQPEYEFFNPAFVKVDRIIDEGELSTPNGEIQIFFLVKWCNTPYDGSTWELRDEIMKIDATKVHEFYARKIIPGPDEARQLPRPPRGAFRKLKESPIFKNGNQLRQYQMEGLNWLLDCWFNEQACIMADEMGLGKTVQSVTFLNETHTTYRIRGPFLVIAPLSTIPHWHREFEAWTDMNVIVFHGNQPSRNLLVDTEFYYKDAQGQIVPGLYKFDVLITTYEMIVAASAQLKPIAWRSIVVDEAHRLKNSASKVSEILKTYNLEHRVLLTGTPLQNSLDELFALLNFLEPTRFYNEKAFLAEYGNLKTAAEVDKLQQLLKPLMLRRFKEDVEKSIPVKEETIIEVELTTTQKAFYRAILEKNFGFLKKGGSAGPSLINIMMELRKCCIHPYLIAGAEDRIVAEKNAVTAEAQYQCLIEASGKLVLIDKLLRKLKEGGHKVLIFSQMTRCLDLLQDYLRGRAYPYERIDGSIRGDMRQAAIDRFSTTPDSFVFLLCTRAGGVGINLTAADTVVIFDSDWNPQNDLQATARCHRIGQTKPVQIYRLVTRNTYEKEMFDRASIKLGLDKAVLQKMDVMPNADDLSDMPKPPSSLSKKEVEELLKKGAYGALLDDDETSAKFCEEDIDQILERRTTVIKHSGNEKGSVFSKATFSSTPSGEEVDVNDPQFWDKWAERANVDLQDITTKDQLIINAPRSRRQVQRFGKEQDGSDSEDKDYVSDPDFEDAHGDKDVKDTGPKKREAPRPWSMAEKLMFERKLMIYGYGRWDQMRVFFPRRSEKDLNAVAHCMVRRVMNDMTASSDDDHKLISDLETVLAECDTASGYEAPSIGDIPFDRASKKSTIEFRSFLLNATQEYIDHIRKKGRNLVLRVQLIHTIRNLIPKDWEVAKQMIIPHVSGVPPASWWGDDEDRDLMLAIIKYGYLVTEPQYEAVRNDPEFCFYGRKYDLRASGDGNDDDDGEGSSSRRSRQTSYGADHGDGDVLAWPSKSDIGLRLRRIISALQRQNQVELRKTNLAEKDKSKEKMRLDRQRQREEAAQEKKLQKEIELASRWTKKDKSEFYKTITSFGVVRLRNGASQSRSRSSSSMGYHPGHSSSSHSRRHSRHNPHSITVEHDWTRFKELAGLTKKPDEVMEEYYHHVMKVCQQVVDRHNALPERNSRESSLVSTNKHESEEATKDEEKEDKEEEDRDDSSGDVPPLDRARRVLKRVELMNNLRDEVLANPKLDDLLAASRRSPGLPSWWKVGIHDRPFLEGLAKHGIHRQDLIVEDEDLPFADVSRHYAELQREHKEKQAAEAAAAAERGEMDVDPAVPKGEQTEAKIEETPHLPLIEDSKGMEGIYAEDAHMKVEEPPKVEGPSLPSVNVGGESHLGSEAMIIDSVAQPHNENITAEVEDVKAEGTLGEEIKAEGVKAEDDLKDDIKPEVDSAIKVENSVAVVGEDDMALDGVESKAEEGAAVTTVVAPKAGPPPPSEPEEFVWLKEAVVLRRMDHLMDIVIHPKPVSKKKLRHHAAQLALNNSILANKNKKKGAEDEEDSDSDRSDHDHHDDRQDSSMTGSPAPASPASNSKKRSRTSTKESKQLVTINGNDEDKSPSGAKKSGLKLTIKLGKMPSGKKEAKESKSRKQVYEVKDHVERREEKAESSSGSDTDEMMALASKQVEYLQRKIMEKKSKGPSSKSSSVSRESSSRTSPSHRHHYDDHDRPSHRKSSSSTLKRRRRNRSVSSTSSSGSSSASSRSGSSSSSGSGSSSSSSGSDSDSRSDSDSEARRRRRRRRERDHKYSRRRDSYSPASRDRMKKRTHSPDRRDRDRDRERDHDRHRDYERDRERHHRDYAQSSSATTPSSSSKPRHYGHPYDGSLDTYHNAASASASPMSIVSRNVTSLKLSTSSNGKRKVSTPRSEEGSYGSEGVSSNFSGGYGDEPSGQTVGSFEDEEEDRYDYQDEDEDDDAYRKRARA